MTPFLREKIKYKTNPAATSPFSTVAGNRALCLIPLIREQSRCIDSPSAKRAMSKAVALY